MTQQGRASLRAQGVRIGPGSPWLDTNSSQWINVLTLTQEGTGFEIGNADTNEFIFIRADREGRTGIGVDLKAGAWSSPSAARANRFGTISATGGLVARGGPRPSVRNVVAKYNTESGEAPPKWEDGAGVNITDDNGQPIGNTGFTTNLARTVYTPVVARSDSAAARVTATADYRRFGREILGIRLDIKVAGGSGYITASLPCRPFKDTVLTGFDRATGRSSTRPDRFRRSDSLHLQHGRNCAAERQRPASAYRRSGMQGLTPMPGPDDRGDGAGQIRLPRAPRGFVDQIWLFGGRTVRATS
ncbi:hypothetical protein ACU4GR_20210 [Methylobacterium oryzae CBMB20]